MNPSASAHLHVVSRPQHTCATCAMLTAVARGVPAATAAHAWRLANDPTGPRASAQRDALLAAARSAIAHWPPSDGSDEERAARLAAVRSSRAIWSLLWLLDQQPREGEGMAEPQPARQRERDWWLQP